MFVFTGEKLVKLKNIYKLNIKLCVYLSGGINTRGWLGGGEV